MLEPPAGRCDRAGRTVRSRAVPVRAGAERQGSSRASPRPTSAIQTPSGDCDGRPCTVSPRWLASRPGGWASVNRWTAATCHRTSYPSEVSRREGAVAVRSGSAGAIGPPTPAGDRRRTSEVMREENGACGAVQRDELLEAHRRSRVDGEASQVAAYVDVRTLANLAAPGTSGPYPGGAGMATASQWLEGARPRTLPAAVAPVARGPALRLRSTASPRSCPAGLLVAVALQVAVNYANDYSDGPRHRRRPGRAAATRGFGGATPQRSSGRRCSVPGRCRCRAGAGAAGRVVAAAVGAACIVAAWFYTGGGRRMGAWVRSVFVFFGRTVGTIVQAGEITVSSVGRHRLRRAGLRDPGGQQPARHPHRRGRRQTDPRGPARNRRTRLLYVALCSRRTPWSC
jgi:hypothetical protein